MTLERRKEHLRSRRNHEEELIVAHGEAWLFSDETALLVMREEIERKKTTTSYLTSFLKAVEDGKRTQDEYDASARAIVKAEIAREKVLDKAEAASLAMVDGGSKCAHHTNMLKLSKGATAEARKMLA